VFRKNGSGPRSCHPIATNASSSEYSSPRKSLGDRSSLRETLEDNHQLMAQDPHAVTSLGVLVMKIAEGALNAIKVLERVLFRSLTAFSVTSP
jgi:hypothetical protein